MIDPRLFWLFTQIRKLTPKANLRCLSNGWYLNQHLVDLLWQFGVQSLHLTAYSEAAFKRFDSFKFPDGMNVNIVPTYGTIRHLDKRIRIYDLAPEPHLRSECYEPFAHVLIRATGQVGFCCLDWADKHSFANLHDKSIQEILAGPEMLATFREVYEGPRKPFVCQRCYWGEVVK
jgi:hypothetical protein